MASGLTPEFLQELRDRCDIVELISQYIPVQKKGSRYFACCPFHNEKTSSFCINQQAQYYHCFGCGASGDIIKFVMEEENMSYIDAVQYLADKAGVEMPQIKFDPQSKQKKEHKDVLKQIMRDAALYYYTNLFDEKRGKEAREYLHSRGISDETAKRYGLGLSPDYDSMVGYLRRKEYKLADLLECGLISSVDRPSDAFANRIIVPIMNGMGEVIAFGGRIYHGEQDVAKYKNSTNTTLFDKGHTVYGINFIKKDKRQNGIAYQDLILVEGYMDVISLGAVGITNAVACMGTALTDGQAREISRMTRNLYVCYDGDGAGRKAAEKNVDILAKTGMELKVISLDDGKDPDETVRADGYEGFMRKKSEALPVMEYKLKLCADANELNSVDGRAKYVQSALKVLRLVENTAEREVYLNLVSKNSRVSVETLKEEIKQAPQIKKEQENPFATQEKENKLLRASRFVVRKILDNANYIIYSQIKKEWLAHPIHQCIFDWAKTQSVGEVKVGRMYDVVGYDEEIDFILNVRVAFANNASNAKESEYFIDCLKILADEYITSQLACLKDQDNRVTDSEEHKAIRMEINKLILAKKSKSIEDKL